MRHPITIALTWSLLIAVGGCYLEDPMHRKPPADPLTKKIPADRARASILGPEASNVDFDAIARFPEPGWQVPRAVEYSPDGKLVTYLQSESEGETMALFGFDVAAKSARVLVRASDLAKHARPISREEELRRERQRKRIRGVTEYRWARRAQVMVIPYGGDLFMRDAAGAITRLTESPEPDLDSKPSDDGERVAFVRGSELWVVDARTKKEAALTKGAPDGVTRGQSDYIAQEEFDEPSGFWWSPAGDRIAYLEVDERGVDALPVMGYRGGRPDLMQQRYPRAGRKNPATRVGILQLEGKKTTWVALPEGERYLGRFQWAPDGKSLWFQALTRDQKRLSVMRADAATGEVREMWSATSPAWIAFVQLRFLERSPRVVATAPSAGHLHLEVRDASTGARVSQLTSGDWDVEWIAAVDEERGRVAFTGTYAAPLERRLHVVPLAGGEIATLTMEHGVHAVRMSPTGRGFFDEHSATDRLPRATIHGDDGAALGEIAPAPEPDLPRMKLRTVEHLEVKSPGGQTLHGALLAPRVIEPGKKYPVVVMVYGGPGVQTVLDAWSPRLLWQHLADRGVVVFQLDNRGSAGRGPAFEAPIHERLGEAELADQLAGLDALRSLPYVDLERVAIYGHSYGGYMATLALLAAPDRFKVGVAGSPVTDWALYDTGYTERYMGTPEQNAAGYAATDLGKIAGNLRGKLLLMHAMMDENVHFEHSAHLIEAFIAAGKTFDLLVFPGERHGYRDPATRRYAMRRVVDYLVEHL